MGRRSIRVLVMEVNGKLSCFWFASRSYLMLLGTLFQVVELDGVIGDLAGRHFGFIENDRMKVTYLVF